MQFYSLTLHMNHSNLLSATVLANQIAQSEPPASSSDLFGEDKVVNPK